MDLSIVIPVYNTNLEILLECFDSIRISDEITFEVIIVDDGSDEETGLFCKEYVDCHKNWIYTYQENAGVSAARNTGMACAGGRYIMFVDADDTLIPEALDPTHISGEWDVVFFDYLLCREGKVYTAKPLEQTAGNVCKKDFLIASYRNKTNAICAKLFRRDLLEKAGVRFDVSMIIAEDARFVLTAILESEKLTYVPKPVYRYAFTQDTGNSRLARFPVKAIENILYYYGYKMDILDSRNNELNLTSAETEQMYAAINAQVVKDLFEAVGSLTAMKMVYQDILTMIAQNMEQVYKAYGNSFSWITNMKCYLLRHKWVCLIRLCAYLRLVYLKMC